MILDNSGFDLGLILSAGYLKFAMYSAIIINFFTGELHPLMAVFVFFFGQVLLAIITGLIESFMARFRMSHNSQFIFALSSVSLLIFLGVLLILGKLA
jgi:formate hydrogenlyase subunit 4